MQSHDWIELFRLIPPDQHNQLVILTNNRVELNIELLLRTEPGYVVFRGRVCGQNDDGRLFFIPYSQITYININRFVSEDELKAILGSVHIPEALSDNDESEPDDEAPPFVMPEALLPPVAQPSSSALPASVSLLARQAPAVAPPSVVAASKPMTVSSLPPIPAEAANAKSSILDRLRAQRNAAKGPKR